MLHNITPNFHAVNGVVTNQLEEIFMRVNFLVNENAHDLGILAV